MAISNAMSAGGPHYKKKVFVLMYSEKDDPNEAVKHITKLLEGIPELKGRFEAVVKVVDMKTGLKDLGGDIII